VQGECRAETRSSYAEPLPAIAQTSQNVCAKLRIFFKLCKYFNLLKYIVQRYSTLFYVIPKYLRFSLAISTIFSTFVSSNMFNQQNQLPMTNHPCSMGRTELASRYFPHIQPQTAWQKLRGLLAEDPDLAPLTQLKRRTFLPAEVNIIYQHLGQP